MTTTGFSLKIKSDLCLMTGFIGTILTFAALFLLCDVRSDQGVVFTPKNSTSEQIIRHFDTGVYLGGAFILLGFGFKVREISHEKN